MQRVLNKKILNDLMKKEVIIILIILIFGIFIIKTKNYIQEKSEIESINVQYQEKGTQDYDPLWNSRIEKTLTSVTCLNPPTAYFGNNTYTGPMIDAHWHIPGIPDSEPSKEEDKADGNRPLLGVNMNIEDIVCTLEREGTLKVFAFFPVYKEISPPMVEVVNKVMKKYPDKFVPFIMPPDNDDSPDGSPTVDAETLRSMLEIEPGLFKGYGEIGLYERGDNGGPKGSDALPPDSKRLNDIYPLVRENKILVYFHLGEGQKESFERTLEANPDINFIFHGDQLIDYENGVQNLNNIDEILSNHPNAYYEVDELWGDVFILRPEINKEEFLKHFENYENLLEQDVRTWKDFIKEHQDQVIWGTDRGWSADWSADEDIGLTMTGYARAFINRLDPEVQEKYAYKNAEKLLMSVN